MDEEDRRLVFKYNRVILKDPDQFRARMDGLENTLEYQFRDSHPRHCWNYPTALAWLEEQYLEIIAQFRRDYPEVICDFADAYMIEMVVRVANRIQYDSPKALPPRLV